MVNVTVTKGAPVNGSATLYGQVLAGQTTAQTGSYSDNYQNGDTALAIYEASGSSPPKSCAGAVQQTSYFPFNVTATVANVCAVSAGAILNFGTVASTATNLSGSNTITVACPSGTAYYVGLAPSNGNTAGAGTMKGTGSNPDQVPYQLRSAAGMNGKIWGNTATSTKVGNGVAGNGNGSGQSLTVYATTPNANFRPDTYTDTVTINVNY
jgi:spore coat protein U-like protein